VLIRTLIPYLASLRPTVQWTDAQWGIAAEFLLKLIWLADALAIFRYDKRTIHDLMAGTKVIDIKKYRIHLAEEKH